MAPTRQCERCREWVSLDLDAELTEFEGTALRRHLSRCADCRAFAADVRSTTALLRSARLEELPVEVPALPARRGGDIVARGRAAQRALVGAAAAAAAVAAVFGSGLSGDQHAGSVAVPTAAAANLDLRSLHALRVAELHVPAVSLANIHIRVIELD